MRIPHKFGETIEVCDCFLNLPSVIGAKGYTKSYGCMDQNQAMSAACVLSNLFISFRFLGFYELYCMLEP